MILKGRWETGEKDEIAHFLFNQIPPGGKVVISSGPLKVAMFFQGGKLVRFEVNGSSVSRMWEIKGTLLTLLHRDKADFFISDDPPPDGGDNLNVPFPALVMDVMAIKDSLPEEVPELSGTIFVKLRGIPKGGDGEEFVRTLRLRYKHGAPIDRIRKDFSHIFPKYMNTLMYSLKTGGYLDFTGLEEDMPIPPVLLFLLVLFVSVVSGCVATFLVFKIL